MRRLHFHQVLALGWLVAFGVGTVALAVPAYAGLAAGLTTDSASCRGELVVTGDDGTLTTITQDTDRATVDPSGTYSGTGSINGGKGKKERAYSGSLKIDLPASPTAWCWPRSRRSAGSAPDTPLTH